MSSYNRVTLIGNLTRTPELRKTKSDNSVTELGLALNRAWYNENGQKQEDVTFVDVTLWGRNAENAVQYLQKGRSVLVEGRLQLETWQDKQSGQDRSKLKVVADLIQFLGGGQERSAASGEGVSENRSADRPAGRTHRRERDDRDDRQAPESAVECHEDEAPVRRSPERQERRPEERRSRVRQPVA
ncbi:MAG: single-stranded DNA-binding protein [Verrucomicrobiaceae bacterium]|nr:single-stranded DNA-binding protein [Verrucomicrobiaceae bacterium]